MNATDFDDQLEEFKKEFDILRKVNSPYMITFYGAVIEKNLSMVMELCERGSLYDVLVKVRCCLSILGNPKRKFHFGVEYFLFSVVVGVGVFYV